MKKKQRKLLFWSGTVVLVVTLWWFFSFLIGGGVEPLAIQEGEWTKGAVNAHVTLIEYSDFQCPACNVYYPMVQQLEEDFSADDLRVVYRHFPLFTIHQNANLAAQAAEAAGMQGEFWEMHNMLFDKQSLWANEQNVGEHFISYAKQLGLDVDKFTDDMNSSSARRAVRTDRLTGGKLNITGTPSFFVNGEKIVNPGSYEEFRAIIQTELARTSSQ